MDYAEVRKRKENTSYLWEKEKNPKSQGLVQLLLCLSCRTTDWEGKSIENVFTVLESDTLHSGFFLHRRSLKRP